MNNLWQEDVMICADTVCQLMFEFIVCSHFSYFPIAFLVKQKQRPSSVACPDLQRVVRKEGIRELGSSLGVVGFPQESTLEVQRKYWWTEERSRNTDLIPQSQIFNFKHLSINSSWLDGRHIRLFARFHTALSIVCNLLQFCSKVTEICFLWIVNLCF